MKTARIVHVVCLSVIVALALPVAAQDEPPPGRDPAAEQEIHNRLAAIEPAAVSIFQEATRAADARDFEAAREGYQQVLQLAPGFPDAARRLSYVELMLDNVEAALEYARQAFEFDPSPYNQLALARALVASDDPSHIADALKHAREVVRTLPEDPDANLVLLLAGAEIGSEDAIRQASTTLVEVAPDFPPGHYYAGLMMAKRGRWEEAERELRLAQELGMEAKYVQEALQSGIVGRARLRRWVRWGGYAIVGWLIGLGGLFVMGVLLSHLTLAAARRTRPASQFQVGLLERFVRTIYRIVIAVTSAYFYVSIPILIALVLLAAGGYAYFSLSSGSLYLILLALGAIGIALLIIYAVIASLFARARDSDPGRLLPREEAPQLWALVEEVAARVGTRPVDAIYVRAFPGIAVMERGPLRRTLRGSGQRCLILGLGSLPGMTQRQFRAVLAHEYGHFVGRDTAGGRLARRVRYSIYRMAEELRSSGQASWYNPAWLFIRGYYRILLRVTLGASRLQEILADRCAAAAYGVRNYASALQHIVRQDIAFQFQALQEVGEARQQERACQNLYTLPKLASELEREVEVRLEDKLTRPPSPYDSHPAVKQRLALLRVSEDAVVTEEGGKPAWALIPNVEMWQEEMSAQVASNLRKLEPALAKRLRRRQAGKSSYESKSMAIESPDLSRSGRALRLWAHIGTRRNLWIILLIVLAVVDVVLLDMTIRGDASAVYLAIGCILLVASAILSLAPRSAFVPCSVLYPMIETEHNTVRVTGKLYRAHLSEQSESDMAAVRNGDVGFSQASHRFTNAPFDLMVGEAGELIVLLKREVRQGSTGIGSWYGTTTAAPSAEIPMANPEYWGVCIKPEYLLEVRPGVLFGRWDRPALRFTHRFGGKREEFCVAFSNFAVYEQVVSFLQREGIPVQPPVGLVLPETKDPTTSNDERVALFRWETC